MSLFLLAFLAGALTLLSPCVLPVLPFVFGRADLGLRRGGLPLLAGMAVSFAAAASLATVAGGWAVAANVYGRRIALGLMAVFGAMLLFPALAERLTRPFVSVGTKLAEAAEARRGESGGFAPSFLLGIATGLLWSPCAGPILGLILSGAALEGGGMGTASLLFAYATGAATSLAVALLASGRVFGALTRAAGAGEWARRGLGALTLAAVAAIGLGADTGFLARLSIVDTAGLEQRLLDAFETKPQAMAAGGGERSAGADATMMAPSPAMMSATAQKRRASAEAEQARAMPSLAGATAWLNSPPIDRDSLKGKVALVDFWTYSCVNCLRTLPYVRAWAEKYQDQGFVVIGVHAPEFAFEKDIDNVKKAVADLKISYAVAIDNDYAIWSAFQNRYWPARYLVDAEGRIRHRHFGEGGYEGTESAIQELLAEAGRSAAATDFVRLDHGSVFQTPPGDGGTISPETYIGYRRAENFVSPGGQIEDASTTYRRGEPALNEWSLFGRWTVGPECARAESGGGGVVYRFHARDLNLVMGPGPGGKAARFRVRLDGAAPGASHGADVNAEGQGVATEHRLYQLLRQSGAIEDHTFEIEFLDPGAEAYAFTFG